jgi:hypothetical protein
MHVSCSVSNLPAIDSYFTVSELSDENTPLYVTGAYLMAHPFLYTECSKRKETHGE